MYSRLIAIPHPTPRSGYNELTRMTQSREIAKTHTRNTQLEVKVLDDTLLLELCDELRGLFGDAPFVVFCKVQLESQFEARSQLKAERLEDIEGWVWKPGELLRLHLSLTTERDSLVLNVIGPREAQFSVSSSSLERLEHIFSRVRRLLVGRGGAASPALSQALPTLSRIQQSFSEAVFDLDSGGMDSQELIYSRNNMLEERPNLPPSPLFEVHRRLRGQQYSWLELSMLVPLFLRVSESMPHFSLRVRGREVKSAGVSALLEQGLHEGGTVDSLRMALYPRTPDALSASLLISRAEGTVLQVLGPDQEMVQEWAASMLSRLSKVPRRSSKLALAFVLARALGIVAVSFLTLRLGLALGVSSVGEVTALAMLCGLLGLVLGGWLRIVYRKLWPEARVELELSRSSLRVSMLYTLVLGLGLPLVCFGLGALL